MKMLAIALLAGAAASAPVRAEEAVRSFASEGVKALTIEAEAGDVSVQAGGPEIRVEVTKPDAERCEVTMEEKADVLVLRAAPKGRWFGRKSCRAGFRVRAPSAVPLDAATVSGELAMDGAAGGLKLKTVSGNVRLQAVAGKLDLKTTSGDIKGQTSAGEVSVRTVSGDVALEGLAGAAAADSVSGKLKLTWAKAPASGEVRVKTVSGDIELGFPRETKPRAELSTTSGDETNELGDYREAGLRVTARSVSGDVRLRATGS